MLVVSGLLSCTSKATDWSVGQRHVEIPLLIGIPVPEELGFVGTSKGKERLGAQHQSLFLDRHAIGNPKTLLMGSHDSRQGAETPR